jgi:hypothetical protein
MIYIYILKASFFINGISLKRLKRRIGDTALGVAKFFLKGLTTAQIVATS